MNDTEGEHKTFGDEGTIFRGDCLEVMREMEKGEITLGFTSTQSTTTSISTNSTMKRTGGKEKKFHIKNTKNSL